MGDAADDAERRAEFEREHEGVFEAEEAESAGDEETLALKTTELVHPVSGRIYDLEKPEDAAEATAELRALEAQLVAWRRSAEDTLIEESKLRGTKTLRYGNVEINISGGPGATGIDVEILRRELAAAGCPSDRIEAAIKTEIEEKADRTVCRQLAGANPAYKAAIDKATYTFEKRYGVGVKALAAR